MTSDIDCPGREGGISIFGYRTTPGRISPRAHIAHICTQFVILRLYATRMSSRHVVVDFVAASYTEQGGRACDSIGELVSMGTNCLSDNDTRVTAIEVFNERFHAGIARVLRGAMCAAYSERDLTLSELHSQA